MEEKYIPPSWAGKPPSGLHLDVVKGDKLIQKFMIDEKNYYLFGRNSKICDFVTDHASCSRLHAALIWHKDLERAFLIDLGSVHGTFVGSIRLEIQKPQPIPIDCSIHFGASTRYYILREKPQNLLLLNENISDEYRSLNGSRLNELPEDETELENLTEFNTAHNRRITSMGLEDALETKNNSFAKHFNSSSTLSALNPLIELNKKEKRHSVRFYDREDIINPEDIDPSIGRYRNMVQTIIVPKASSDSRNPLALQNSKTLHPKALIGKANNGTGPHYVKFGNPTLPSNLYSDSDHPLIQPEDNDFRPTANVNISPFQPRKANAKMQLNVPNPAPNVDVNFSATSLDNMMHLNYHAKNSLNHPSIKRKSAGDKPEDKEIIPTNLDETQGQEDAIAHHHKKKKYAKEAWPGKRHNNPMPMTNLPSTLLI